MGEMGFNPASFGRPFVRVINAGLPRTFLLESRTRLADITTICSSAPLRRRLLEILRDDFVRNAVVPWQQLRLRLP